MRRRSSGGGIGLCRRRARLVRFGRPVQGRLSNQRLPPISPVRVVRRVVRVVREVREVQNVPEVREVCECVAVANCVMTRVLVLRSNHLAPHEGHARGSGNCFRVAR
jgi:hypothetical protein